MAFARPWSNQGSESTEATLELCGRGISRGSALQHFQTMVGGIADYLKRPMQPDEEASAQIVYGMRSIIISAVFGCVAPNWRIRDCGGGSFW